MDRSLAPQMMNSGTLGPEPQAKGGGGNSRRQVKSLVKQEAPPCGEMLESLVAAWLDSEGSGPCRPIG